MSETARQFTSVFNAVCTYGWRQRERNGVRLHHALYRPLKAQFPSLVSDHHIQARVKAAEALRSVLVRQARGKRVTCPRSAACPPRYNLHTFSLDWRTRVVKLSTTGGRQAIPFTLPITVDRFSGCETDTADLLHREGRWWLHVAVTVPAPEVERCDAVVGVDLGLALPAVTSTASFLGERQVARPGSKVVPPQARACSARGRRVPSDISGVCEGSKRGSAGTATTCSVSVLFRPSLSGAPLRWSA